MKLLVRNVFSHVCLSFCLSKGESHYHDHYPWCIGLYCTGNLLTTWTYSNLFNLDLTVQGYPPPPQRNVHYEARTVSGWAVGILLECFLALHYCWNPRALIVIFTARKLSCGKVMFLHLSVSHSAHRGSPWQRPPLTETPWQRPFGQTPPGQRPPVR